MLLKSMSNYRNYYFFIILFSLVFIVSCSTSTPTNPNPSTNQKPVVEDLEISTNSEQEVTVTLKGSDADNDDFSYEVTSQPSNGTLGVINMDKIVYTPNSDFVGEDSFNYAARDAQGLGLSADVKIIVNQVDTTPPNTAPQVNNQSFSVQENKAVNTVVGNVVATDIEGGALTYEIVGGNAQTTFTINSATGDLRLAKRPNFEAQTSYSLQVKVSDVGGLSKTAIVTIQIANVDYGKVVFVGDSITRGWGSASGTGWPTKVQTALNTSYAGDFTIQNKGIDGDTAVGLKNRLASQVVSQNPSYVTVQIGTNDVYNNGGTAPASATVASYEAEVAAILQNLKTTPSIKQVFVLGIISPIKSASDANFPGLIQMPQAQLDSQVAAFNAALQRQAQQRGFVYVNLAAQFPADAPGRLAWLPDGVHPSETGYNRIASIVEGQLRANFN